MSRILANEGLFFGSLFVSAFSFERKMLAPLVVLNRFLSHSSFQICSATFPIEYASASFVHKNLLCTAPYSMNFYFLVYFAKSSVKGFK
jgi:hypothetical protein